MKKLELDRAWELRGRWRQHSVAQWQVRKTSHWSQGKWQSRQRWKQPTATTNLKQQQHTVIYGNIQQPVVSQCGFIPNLQFVAFVVCRQRRQTDSNQLSNIKEFLCNYYTQRCEMMRVVLIMGLSLVWRRPVQATEQIFPHVRPFHRWVVILVASCSLLLCCPLVQRWISTWVSRCLDGWAAAVDEHIIYQCNYDYVTMSDNIIQNSDLLCFF